MLNSKRTIWNNYNKNGNNTEDKNNMITIRTLINFNSISCLLRCCVNSQVTNNRKIATCKQKWQMPRNRTHVKKHRHSGQPTSLETTGMKYTIKQCQCTKTTFWQSCLRNCVLQPCNSQTNLTIFQLVQCEIIHAWKDQISRTENI